MKRKLRNESIELFKELNVMFSEWKKAGTESNQIKLVKATLNDFYQDNKIKVANNNKFSTRVYMTPEQESKLLDIAFKMVEDSGSYLSSYKQIAKNKKSPFYGMSISEVVKNIDRLKNYRDDGLMKTLFDSWEIIEIYSRAEEEGISEEDLEYMIMFEYEGSGATHESLTDRIIGFIEGDNEW